MNAIIGMTELALDTELDTHQREYLALVKTSADSLLGIINDILDVSSMEAGELKFEQIEFGLRSSASLALRSLAPAARRKGLSLGMRIDPATPDVLSGDPHRLRQVLINLIANAIKFTAAGEVNVRITPQEITAEQTTLRFAVQDTGIGIAADQQEHIFEAFAQADSASTRSSSPTPRSTSTPTPRSWPRSPF
jgi:signal transduction histidine kinase